MANLMNKYLVILSAVVLLSMSLVSCAEGPFIVAHKKASLTRLKSGAERVSVSIDIYNQGSATAYDVSLNDDSWSNEYFNIVSGNTSTSWERLDAGSILSHTFELESKLQKLFYATPAIIRFRVPTKAALQEAISTPLLPLDLLADKPVEKKFDLRLLAKYGSLVSVISIVVLFIYLVATPSKSSAAKGGKKKR
ncbi:Translocon-associated protein subunit beta [Heracleum sosnowskyi]|uniref:Translocon-associated protein subunit beta n=1 Tax=Heracleum sosnowskyi TaxID=360622 RepID=A0AAD8H2S7_9APIA|nr:Translocon-associated protein subunit beta [Heracleum sosnowskyi]